MFKRIVLTVVSVTLVTVMAFAVLSGVYAADEDRIYYSDLFFGFSPDYLNDKEVEKNVWKKYSSLRLHTRETGDIMEKIYNDYADSFAGFWSSFKTGLNYSTDAMFSLKFKDYANLMSDTYGNTEHIYTNSLDDANMEMVKYLLKTSVGDAALFGGNGTGVAAKTMKFMKDLAEFYEDIRKNYVIEKMTDYEIVEIVFEEARNGGLFVHISSTNLTLVEEVILEDLSGYLKMFGAAAKAFEMMQTIFVGIMLEDVRMDVINDVISASSSDYCVYDGMIRLRDKLSGGFLQYFKNSYLQPKIIDKLHGEITDALLSPLGTTYGLIGDALSIASTVVFDILFDVPDLGEMTKQKTLASYSSELYEILRGKLLSFYGNVDSNDVRELESIFAAYIAATNAALEESRSMAKDNEYELGQIILVWEDYDYSTFIGEITESISSIPAAERELKDHGTVSNLTSTFRAASDVLEEDSIYLCNGAFNGSLSYNIDTTIKAEDGVVPYITGSLTINPSSYEGKSVKIPEGLTLEIGGDVKVEGNSDYYAYLRNEGTLICNGDITANSRGRYNAPSTNTSTLVVRGNVSFTEPYTIYGTVVFDGDEQQELDMTYVKNIEVTNKNGIKYLDNLYLEGSFKLNGNPLELNGFNTYLEGNATLDGSDFHEVVVRSDYTLTYDVNANVKITTLGSSSTSLTIPEDADVEINGNVNVSGTSDYYAYLKNYGRLTVNGDITTSSRGLYNAPSTNTSTLVVRGNVSFTEPYTVYGTVVFDGDEQQELDMSYVKNIEVTNEKGIKYLDNLYLEGNFKLNGNPLDLNGFNTYLEGNATLDDSDFHDVVVRSDYTLTYDVNANVTVIASQYSGTSLTIPEGADVEINGNVTLNGNSDYSSYLRNEGTLTVNGDITANSRGRYNAPSTNTSTLVVRGNVSFTEPYTVYGTVVFDGDEQQEIDMPYVKNIEVTNEKGIKYLDNLYLEGSFKLNGNPLELNGFKTYLEGNATLDGSDFHEVVVRSDYTLTYDVNANVTVIASQYSGTSLTIPEGADVEINGNVTLNGNSDYSSYLRNEGTLTVNGDITANSRGRYNAPSTNTSTLVVRGNVSFTEPYTVYGTVVFDGDEQQELDMSYVKNIEVTNEKGIKYLDNLYLEGNFKLNGNPLELNGFNTYLRENATLDGSDFHDVVVRSDYTLTYDVNANLTITTSGSSSTSLTIPEDADVEINGNVNVAGISDYYAYLKNNGKLSVGGDLTVGNTGYYRDTEASTLVLKKNVSINSSIKGTVVFDGDEQQELDMSYVKNIEVTNEKGIKYLDNLYLEGSFKLNGNPLDLNGFNTYLERNATLDGSDFHDVVVRSDYTLTYDVNANVTVIASQYSGTSLTILEGAEVEINGNVTFKGNNTFSSYLRNEGTLTIDGDITIGSNSSYVDSANSVLIVTGDVIIESTRTIYGTIVFDGDDEQKADLRFAAVIEIKNGSDAGVVFEKSINVSKLFDHKGNSFTLYNNGSGSTFVDHDGDGLNDNVDPHPTIKESEIEYTLTLKDENGELIFSEVYKNGEEVHPPIIVPEESFTHTYTFLGWATSPMGAVEYPAGEPITISEDITLYAVVEKKAKPAFIVFQPTNESAQNGEKVSTTVIAAGEDLTYTWYYTSNGNTTEFFVSSVTEATYTTVMNDSRAGRKVYCVITDKYGNSVTTEVVTLSMLSNVTITSQPTNKTAANGETASTTVVAEGEGLKYTWYYTSNGNTTEFYVSSVTGATYTTVMNDSRAGRKVYCVITDKYGNSVTTDVVTLSMLSNVTITSQPTNETAQNGATVSTTVVAEGEGLTYTWYYTLNKNGLEFYVSSVTGATYTTVMNDSRAGRKVYCVITDKYGNSVTTDVVTLSMSSELAITKQPTNVTAANGEKVVTTVTATGEGLTYTWYYTLNKNGVEFYVSSVTGATYTTVMNDSRAGRKVYCVITDKYGNSVTTEVVTLSMSSELAITKQPTNVTVANGSKAATTVTATGEELTYTWYYTSNGKTSQFYVSSVTSATYTTTMDATRDGRKVYCVITDKYGNTVKTNTVTLTMK